MNKLAVILNLPLRYSVMKNIFIILLILFAFVPSYSQETILEKIIITFDYFKHPSTEFKINYITNDLTCTMFAPGKPKRITFKKVYPFLNKQFETLKRELNKDIPETVVEKSENSFDGGGFTIHYYKKNGEISKLIITNPRRSNIKYKNDFKKIDTFFEFAYSLVKDTLGIKAIDESFDPYFSGLPIRKTSDNPLEYKVWGGISGNASMNESLISFFNDLPKDKCVIIDCNDQLSYALQQDILRLYIIKNSNIRFIHNSYLKYTREDLLQIREKIKNAENNHEGLDQFSNNSTYHLYISNRQGLDKWLELPEKSIYKTEEEIRENCR